MRAIHLSAYQEFLTHTMVRLFATTAILPGDGEFETHRSSGKCLAIVDKALRNAVETGIVTLRDPQFLLPLPVGVRESKDSVISRADFQRFAEMLGANVQVHDNCDAPNEIGYTIRGAARALAQKYGISESGMRDSLYQATPLEKLRIRNPETGMPYIPKLTGEFFERISFADLNEWLNKSGVVYELDVGPDDGTNVQSGRDGRPVGINRNEVMRAFPVRSNWLGNRNYWDEKLGKPPRWLIAAQLSPGKPGVSARWDPLLVAHALLGKGAMTLNALDAAIRNHFPESLEKWREQTGDSRS